MTYYHSVRKDSGQPILMDSGPPRPYTEGMTAAGAAVTRKAFRDKETRLLRKSTGSTVSDIVFTGVFNERLWTMTEVEDTPLKVDDTFPSKEILLIRTWMFKKLLYAARCNIDGKRCYMYQHTASSASESMNRANKATRSRLAVDVVSSSRLLLQLCASRYREKCKEMAWKCQEALTPHGKKLRDKIFDKVDFRKYNIRMGDSHDDRWECTVMRVGRGLVDRRCYFMKEESEWGTIFGGCSCGIPYTDGVPCHHMIATVKSSWIEGLNPNNAMPFWRKTECWRRKYPADTNVT